MFISRDEIRNITGYNVSLTVLNAAQAMVETWAGREESEVDNPRDLGILKKATMWQAVYMNNSGTDIMEQAIVKSMTQGETTTTFDTTQFAPFMSPWAMKAMKKLSWMGTRSVDIGPMGRRGYNASPNELWRRDYL